ncbi:flavin reductase family protein [Streptomyces sp. NPDC059248]|uniref:flavin reductase family protein n=1 Tax=Streptomyces sp. NPDC059248 TaxID=3346791 RepID=UPI0036A60D1C
MSADAGGPGAGAESGAFREAMRLWATGVAVVTTRSDEGPHGTTLNSLLSVSLDPPTLLISLRRGSRTDDTVREAGRFTVNVLAAGQEAVADRFTRRRSFGAEEFAGVRHRPSPDGGGPELEGSAVVMTCRTVRRIEVADHALVVAEVTGVRRPSAPFGGPLLYVERRYRGLAGRAPDVEG